MIYLHVYNGAVSKVASSRELLLKNLSHYLKQPISAIEILKNENGKPYIEGIYFSLSHSRDTMVQAFSFEQKLGVDLEYKNNQRNPMRISKRYFHDDESEHMQSLDKGSRLNLFYQLWTAKEALCKYHGGRLWFHLKTKILDNKHSLHQMVDNIYLKTFDLIEDFQLTIASDQKINEVEIRTI